MRKFNIIFLISILFLMCAAVLYILFFNIYGKHIEQEDQISLIKANWEANDYKKVIELSQSYLETYPDDSQVLLLSGLAKFSNLYFEYDTYSSLDDNVLWESILTIRKAKTMGLDKNLDDLSNYILGKEYYLLSGSYLEQAVFYLQKASESRKTQDDVAEYLASAYFDSSDFEKAIDVLHKEVKERPKLTIYLALADMYIETSNLDKADETLIDASAYQYTNLEKIAIDMRKARIAMERNELDKAIKMFFDIIEEYPQSIEAHYYLGNTYEKKGDASKARYEWRKAYKLSPYWDKVIEKLDQDQSF